MSDSTTPPTTPPTPTPTPAPVTPVVVAPAPAPVLTPTPAAPYVVTTLEGDVQTAVTDVTGLPTWAKVLIAVVVFGVVVGGGYFLFHGSL